MDINYWRTKFNKKILCWDQGLAGAAAYTGQQNGGSGIIHHNSKDNAEVINPGSDNAYGQDLKGHSPFEISFIAWLCEGPHDKLEGLCEFQHGIANVVLDKVNGAVALDHDLRFVTKFCPPFIQD
ncbi:MAG: hypothetical protein Q9220_005479 [cf. Caloplaca sp. 1 TL-2023]